MPCPPPPPDCATAYLALAQDSCLAELGLLDPAPLGFAEGERDAFGTENAAASEHLILRWDGPLDPAATEVMLASGEESWSILVEELGMAEPYGSDSFKLNIYLGDSGANAPRALGEAYATRDGDGYPMVVLSPEAVADWERGQVVLAHELFHTLQDGSAAHFHYVQDSAGAWLFEATAVWAEAQVYPDEPSTAMWTYAWSFRPERAVDGFVYPSSGSLEELRQYGAFLWIQHLTLAHGPELVPWLWTQQEPDPRLALEARVDVDQAWHDFALAAATWDFPEGARYAAVHDEAAERWPDWDMRSSALEMAAWQEIQAPESLGVRYLELDDQAQRIRVRAPQQGRLRVQLASEAGHTDLGWAPVDHPLEAGQGRTLVLSSGVVDPALGRLELRSDSGGCGGCKSTGAGGVLGALLAAGALARRRRTWCC